MQATITINGRRIAVLMISVCLVIMSVSSFVYRIQGASSHAPSRSAVEAQANSITKEQGAEIQKYMEILKNDPDNRGALTGLGAIFLNSGTWDKAATFWGRYVKLEPEDDGAVYHYALALLNMDKYQESADQFEVLTKLDPKGFQGFYYLGMINIYYLDNKIKGKECLEKVLDLNPDNEEVLKTVRNELQQI